MGILRKLSGYGPVGSLRERVLARCDQLAEEGQTEASFTITQSDVGRVRFDNAVTFIASGLTERGHGLVGVDGDGFDRYRLLRVRLGRPGSSRHISPPSHGNHMAKPLSHSTDVVPIVGSDDSVMWQVDPKGPRYRPDGLVHAIRTKDVPKTIEMFGRTRGVAMCGATTHLWPIAFEPIPSPSGGHYLEVDGGAKLVCCLACTAAREAAGSNPVNRSDRSSASVSSKVSQNLLPSGNVYDKALASANGEYQRCGWNVRIAGCRMLTPGELEIAFVVPGGPGELRSSLEQLPGPNEVQSVAEKCVAFARHTVVPVYMSESMWNDSSPEWAYND